MMKKVFGIFNLRQEAHLFDSWLYIIKSFLAVLTVYMLALTSNLLKKDMISVLFGLMLTLEPATLTGIRSGFSQIYATTLGGVSTAIIVYFFGINIWTVAFSVAFTLYVCLKINWRAVSPVAIFTAIYMTQYVQTAPNGAPSIFLTFKLRMAALGTGVGIAILYNYIFSRLYYRTLEKKRLIYILNELLKHFKQIKKGIKEDQVEMLIQEKRSLSVILENTNELFSLIKDVEKEQGIRESFKQTIINIEDIIHFNYNVIAILVEHYKKNRLQIKIKDLMLQRFDDLIMIIEKLKESIENLKNEKDIFPLVKNAFLDCEKVMKDLMKLNKDPS